jgi:hypothetical protein
VPEDETIFLPNNTTANPTDYSEADHEGYFANHCPRCGALPEDMHLLKGRVRLSGDESFEV